MVPLPLEILPWRWASKLEPVWGEIATNVPFAEWPQVLAGDERVGLKVCFTNLHAPWARRTNENTNELICDYLARRTNFGKVSEAEVDDMVRAMNIRPWKCTGYYTPSEVFAKLAGVALQTGIRPAIAPGADLSHTKG